MDKGRQSHLTVSNEGHLPVSISPFCFYILGASQLHGYQEDLDSQGCLRSQRTILCLTCLCLDVVFEVTVGVGSRQPVRLTRAGSDVDAVAHALLHPPPHARSEPPVQTPQDCSRHETGGFPIPLISKDNFKAELAS